MSVTAYKYPGTAASVAGADTDLTNPDYAKADDTNYTEAVVNAKETKTDVLLVTNFGFAADDIPAGSTIDGIEVIISRWSVADTGDYSVYCYLTASPTGSNLAAALFWVCAQEDVTYGGATNKWGWSPTQANMLDSSFGIGLIGTSSGFLELFVDCIKLRVYYTAAGASFIPQILIPGF
jgi:hypothetical protein